MSNLNLGQLISKYVNFKALSTSTSSQSKSVQQSQLNNVISASTTQSANTASTVNTQIANLGSVDQSVYIKEMMNLPRNLNELVYILQRNITQSQFQQQFNQQMAAQRNLLSQTRAQILAQLQGLNLADSDVLQTNTTLMSQLTSQLKNLPIMSNGMINLSDIAALIQANGKDAVTKLIMAMANAAKQGITDLSQLKETAKLINASVALASQGDNAQILKTLLLLYLPWLPLQDGVGFDLDIETDENSAINDSILIVTIRTINYGTLTAILLLESSHSVFVNIECVDYFPKDELLVRIEAEQKHYSMHSNVAFSTTQNKKSEHSKPEAKINMSNTNEINPFLLLMAHAIIRHTLEIDRGV